MIKKRTVDMKKLLTLNDCMKKKTFAGIAIIIILAVLLIPIRINLEDG